MPLLFPAGLLLAYQPLLLERSYGGGGEGISLLVMGGLAILASSILLLALVSLGHWANKKYGESFHKFLKYAGIVAALFYVVFMIASATSS